MSRAKRVKEKAVPELKEAVVSGKVSVNRAAKIADKPPEKQREQIKRESSRQSPKKSKQQSDEQTYDVMDDVIALTKLRDKLSVNWKAANHKATIRQLFSQFAKEV